MLYADLIMIAVLVSGVQGFGGLALARQARRRGSSPLKSFLWGAILGPAGCYILLTRVGPRVPQDLQAFAACYFVLLLLLLSMLGFVRLAVGAE